MAAEAAPHPEARATAPAAASLPREVGRGERDARTAQLLEVTLSLPGETTTLGRATLVSHGPTARLARALKTLGALWGIGALCVFLPIAHFALVPAFALAGLVGAWLRLRDECSLVEVSGVCPRCKVQRALPASGRYREGRQVHCEGCGSQLEVRSRPAGAAA